MDNSENEKILNFPVHRARPSGIYCEPLNLYFPTFYRVVQNVTREELDAVGLPDEPVVKDCVYYTTRTDPNGYGGTIDVQPLKAMPEDEKDSIIVRHHASEAAAQGYIEAAWDMLDISSMVELCRTPQGIFSLLRRSTPAHWRGPKVVYGALVPADNMIGEDYWTVATDQSGATALFEIGCDA